MKRRVFTAAVLVLALGVMHGCVGGQGRSGERNANAKQYIRLLPETNTGARRQLPSLDENSVLADFLGYAALNNAGLEAAFNRWKAALERIPQVRSLPDPRFTYSYFIEEVETRVGPQEHKFSLSQMFPWFGKLRLRGDAAFQAANAKRERYEAAKLKLFYKVKYVYYEYYYLARAIAVTEENFKLLTYIESVARTKYKTGSTPHPALIKIQVELGKLEDRLRSLRDVRGPIAAKLNAALNRPTETSIPWPRTISKESVSFTDMQLFNALADQNPDLKAIDFKVAREKISIALARKQRYPDIMLGVTQISTDDALMPGTKDSGKDPVVGTISINLPIWQGKYRAAEKEARARHAAALNERRNRENLLVSDLAMALYKFRDAERKIDLYRDTLLPKAKQGFKVTQQAFQAGKASALDLIDAERTLLEFTLSYERALTDRAQRLAEIEKLVGKETPKLGKNRKEKKEN